MTNNSYSVANGVEVNVLRRGGLRQRQFRDGMERSSFLKGGVKFALQVLLRDIEIGTHDASVAAARNSKKFFEYGRIIPFLSQASPSTHNLMLSLKSASSEGTQPAWCLRASG